MNAASIPRNKTEGSKLNAFIILIDTVTCSS